MKSYTDLEQSKKLAEILPIESSDMYWNLLLKDKYARVNNVGHCLGRYCVYAWSLSALLNIIRKIVGYTLYGINNVFISCNLSNEPWKLETKVYDNEVDACYEMIIRLHELKLI